jgi:hypothetical protein
MDPSDFKIKSTGCMLLRMVFRTRCCSCGPEESVRGLV